MGAAPTSGAAPAGGVLVLSAGAGALAAGVPLLVMPAPLVAAAGLALFHESGLLRDYAVFVAAALLTGGWFVHHHFWFLQARAPGPGRAAATGVWGSGAGRRAPAAAARAGAVLGAGRCVSCPALRVAPVATGEERAGRPHPQPMRAQVDLADMTLHTLCKLLLAALLPALALPGLVAVRRARPLATALLLVQVARPPASAVHRRASESLVALTAIMRMLRLRQA